MKQKKIYFPFFIKKRGFIFRELQAATTNDISAQSLFSEKAVSVINHNLFLTQQWMQSCLSCRVLYWVPPELVNRAVAYSA